MVDNRKFVCKVCGKEYGYSIHGECACGGLLSGYHGHTGPCMVSGCDRERKYGRWLSDGNRYVYECEVHKFKGRRFDWRKP